MGTSASKSRGELRPFLAEALTGAPGALLLLGLGAVCFLAALAGGAISLSSGARSEVAVSALALLCALAVCSGVLPVPRTPAWLGVGLLAGFALFSALSISWSVAPADSWLAANRAIAYAAAAAVALVAASSVRDAPAATVLGLAGAALLIALFALGGKVIPGIGVGPLDFDAGNRFSRISEPLDYWNALALICVMAVPACIWIAALRSAAVPVRVGAAVGHAVLALTIALTYSRGAIIGYVVVVAVMVAAGPRRLTRLAITGGGILVVVPAMLLAFLRDDLSSAGVPLGDRIEAGLLLGAVCALGLVALALAAREVARAEARRRIPWGPREARRAWRGIGALAAAVVVIALVVMSFSSGGIPGQVSGWADSFTERGSTISNDPERLVSVNSSNRYSWWKEAAAAFADKPLGGQGAGSFPTLHYLYREDVAPVRSSHSLPLMFLSETGIAGLALGMGGLIVLLWAAVARIRRSEGIERSARLALVAAYTAWLVESLFDWFWEIPALTIAALVAVCVAAAPGPPRRRRVAEPPSRPALAATAAALAAAAIAVSAYLPKAAEDKRLEALQIAVSPEGSLSEAMEQAELARRLNPLAIDPLLTLSALAQRSGDGIQALELLQTATRVAPEDWQPWRRLYAAYVAAGYLPAAGDAYEQYLVKGSFEIGGPVPKRRASSFETHYPPAASPTAFGTPPS